MRPHRKGQGGGSPIVRSEYLIQRFRVVFETGGGWHCVCREFSASNICVHTREADGMRMAQDQIRAGLATGRSQFAQRVWQSRAISGVTSKKSSLR
jgi:hypothetical protein